MIIMKKSSIFFFNLIAFFNEIREKIIKDLK